MSGKTPSFSYVSAPRGPECGNRAFACPVVRFPAPVGRNRPAGRNPGTRQGRRAEGRPPPQKAVGRQAGRRGARPAREREGTQKRGRKKGRPQTPPAPGPRGPQDGPARGGGGGRTHNDAGRAGHQPARPAGRAEPQPTCGDRSDSEGQRLEAAAPQRGTPVTRTLRGWAELEDAQSARAGGAARVPAGRFPGTQHLCAKTGFCVHFTKMRIA